MDLSTDISDTDTIIARESSSDFERLEFPMDNVRGPRRALRLSRSDRYSPTVL